MTAPLDRRIKLRHLACFTEVARAGSLVAAAASLNISQPAATKTIQELEQLVGKPLFDRSRRRLVLTAAGELFQRYAIAGLAALAQGVESVRSSGAEAVIKVGALPTVSAHILPRAVKEFTAAGLLARTRIVTGPNAYLLSLLRAGDVDLVIGRMADPDAIAGLAFEHLYAEQVVFAVRKGHPLLARRDFALEMIEGFPALLPPPDAVIRPTVDHLLVAHGITGLRDEVETVSNAFGRGFTRMTDAIWIISGGVVADDVADGHLALLPVDTAETLGPVGLTTRAGTNLSSAALLLVQAIRDVSATH